MDLFNKYQKLLIAFANHPLGRKYLQIPFNTGKVLKVFDNGFAIEQKNLIRWRVFIGAPIVARKLGMALTSADLIQKINLESLFHYLDLNPRSFTYPLIHFTTINISSGDGNCSNSGPDWTTVRNATTSTAGTTNLYDDIAATGPLLARGFMPADFSSLVGQVSTGTFNGYVKDTAQLESSYTVIVPSTQAAIGTLVSGDYDNITLNSSAEYCARQNHGTTNFPLNAYKNITLNATGITAAGTAIGGNFMTAIRGYNDIENVSPTGGERYVNFQNSREANVPSWDIITYSSTGLQGKIW